MSHTVDFLSVFDPTGPQRMPQGTGLTCEVKSFESVYDARGERRLLQAGTSTAVQTCSYSHSFRSALVVTRFWKHDRRPDYTTLELRSPHMKAALKAVVPAYQTHDIATRHIILRDEPRCLFHYRAELQAYGTILEDREAADHVFYLLRHLQNTLWLEMYNFSAYMEDPSLVPSLDFINLWMAFRPGDLVYIPDSRPKSAGHGRIYRFVEMERCRCDVPSCPNSEWTLTLDGITSDGVMIGHRREKVTLQPYDGFQQLQELPAFPLKYHPDEQDTRQRLAVRGAKFIQLHGYHYRQYSGIAGLFGASSLLNTGRDHVMVRGRIIVDTDAFSEAQPDNSPRLSRSQRKCNPGKGGHLLMTEEDYLICTDEVAGYSLDEKRWGFFKVDTIQDIDFDQGAFDQLKIHPQNKMLISSLIVYWVLKRETPIDNFIKGKGKGMVFLLHGEPGVGKTLAAESIAEEFRKPLLRVDPGTFGTSAAAVEADLSKVFKYAERWRAVCLLDEADVFLEQRRNNNLARNNIVSVFLRLLEYFQGVLFLTTNRVSVLDKAIKSRINLAIHFPALSYQTRLSLWDTFISNVSEKSAELLRSDGSLHRLAQERLNGRQIKNIVRTASALALSRGTTTRLEHITMALDAVKAFEENFEGSQGPGHEEDDQHGEGGLDDAGPSDSTAGSERAGSKRRRGGEGFNSSADARPLSLGIF
ncbi:P-loop containing nucleoside triphosphate hydrolase protein [Parachaetomium inaequale]|uniref:P-loop containing nucleoside triphosphate hydrolase protein n=1 Tax=Parachaetomium inaequale TaxID=2588326 RepID=A0AAN6SSA9_9PEZI|nr:P-loop containing nucleoside triphosphate hydrolase protein [Parachaetomium inaequale]